MSRTAQVQLCHEPGKAGDKLRMQSWIEIQLIGENDSPIAGETCEIRLPGGKVITGTLNEEGIVRVDGIPPGTCFVSFPTLDHDAWVPVEASSDSATPQSDTSGGQAA